MNECTNERMNDGADARMNELTKERMNGHERALAGSYGAGNLTEMNLFQISTR